MFFLEKTMLLSESQKYKHMHLKVTFIDFVVETICFLSQQCVLIAYI